MHKKLIVFDIGNVLIRFDIHRAQKNFDRLEPGSGKKLCGDLWHKILMRRFEQGQLSGRNVYDILKKRHNLRMTFPSFSQAFSNIFVPIRENVNLLARFSQSPYFSTALLSNTNEMHWRYLIRQYPLLKKARHKILSQRVGAMKPSRHIFKALKEKTSFAYRDMLYVDDHPVFIRAAQRLGMRAAVYSGKESLKEIFLSLDVAIPQVKKR